MNYSTNYNLKLVEGSDIFNPLVQDVPNYSAIDAAMFANKEASIDTAVELKSGTVHALTRGHGDSAMFRFVATSAYVSGDTFTVDGVQVTALLTTGEPLGDGAYVIGANVLCCLVGTTLTMFVQSGTVVEAENALKLGGELPSYYATASDLNEVSEVADSAGELATALNAQLGGYSIWTGTQAQYNAIGTKSSTTLYFIHA